MMLPASSLAGVVHIADVIAGFPPPVIDLRTNASDFSLRSEMFTRALRTCYAGCVRNLWSIPE